MLGNENNMDGFLQDSVYHLPKPEKGQFLLVQYSHIRYMDIYKIRIAELIVHTTGNIQNLNWSASSDVAVCAEGERQCPDLTCINYEPCSYRKCSYQEGIEVSSQIHRCTQVTYQLSELECSLFMLSFLQCCYDYREVYNYDHIVAAKRSWDIASSTLESVQNFKWTPEAVSNVQFSFSD